MGSIPAGGAKKQRVKTRCFLFKAEGLECNHNEVVYVIFVLDDIQILIPYTLRVITYIEWFNLSSLIDNPLPTVL